MSDKNKGTKGITLNSPQNFNNGQKYKHESYNNLNINDFNLETPSQNQSNNISMISRPDSNTIIISKNNSIKDDPTSSTNTMPRTKKVRKKKNIY